MSILHADNFNIYGANAALMLNGIYAENAGCSLVADPDGISTPKVLKPGWDGFNNSNTNWRYVYQSGGAPIAGAAFRMWNAALPATNDLASIPIQFRDNGNNPLVSLGILTTGAIRLNINGTLIDTPLPVISAQGWYHIEVKVNHTGTTNVTYEVRVEGITVLGPVNCAAAINSDFYQVAAFHTEIGGHAQLYYIKDLVLWNGAGAQNNDFLGSVLVTNLVPNGDVSLNWALTGGANGYSILADIPPDDTKYISAGLGPIPGAYVGNLSDLPVNSTSVKAVITFVRAAKTDGGDGSLQVGVISGGTTGLGANRPITVAQTYWRDVFELDPHTGAAWLPSAVNAAEIQINRTT